MAAKKKTKRPGDVAGNAVQLCGSQLARSKEKVPAAVARGSKGGKALRPSFPVGNAKKLPRKARSLDGLSAKYRLKRLK
jgi:hypothetical protein